MLKVLRLNWIAFASSACLFAGILFILSRREGLSAVVAVWHRTNGLAFCLAVLLMLVVQGISTWRIKIIAVAEALHGVRYLSLLRIQLISQFVAYGAPVAALSDVAKGAMLKLRFNLPVGQSIRIIFYERICGALGAVVVGAFATLGQLFVATPISLVDLQFAVWGAGLLGGVIILAIGGMRIRSGIGVFDRAARAVILLGNMLRSPMVAGQLLLVSFAQLMGFALVFMVLAEGMSLTVSQIHILLFMPFIFLISSLPIFYQGWGGREAVIILTIGGLGTVSGSQAIALSVAFGIVVFVSSIPGAVFWIMRPSMRKFVQLEVEHASPTGAAPG
jgi:glycosyltransferase 2 family protein